MNKPDSSKIYLVTGAAGFIGFHLSKALLNVGATVIGLDNMNDYYEVSLKEARLNILEEFKEKYNKPDLSLSRDAMAVLTNYAWPGNVRELRNVIARATVLSRANVVEADDFPDKIKRPSEVAGEGIGEDRIYTMAEMERMYAQKVLEYAGGNKLKAARLLDIDPKTLRTKLGL